MPKFSFRLQKATDVQLGIRWRAGAAPHQSVPAVLHAAIAEAESAHPGADSWTLTWLEGRPWCALDDLITVFLGDDTTVRTVSQRSDAASDDEDDAWLDEPGGA